MKKLLFIIGILIGLPCFADTTEILQNLILQEQKVLTCKTDCNEQMTKFYKQLIEQVPIASQGNWDLTENEELYPKTKIIYYRQNDWVGIWINYKHLKTYKLPKIWKKYINIFNDLDTTHLYDYQGTKGINFIKKADKFMNTYPDFTFNYYLKEQRDLITLFICGKIPDFPYHIEDKRVKTFCTSKGIDINEDQ